MRYLVKWQGFPYVESSWLSREELIGSASALVQAVDILPVTEWSDDDWPTFLAMFDEYSSTCLVLCMTG